jgi:hypothetical protein
LSTGARHRHHDASKSTRAVPTAMPMISASPGSTPRRSNRRRLLLMGPLKGAGPSSPRRAWPWRQCVLALVRGSIAQRSLIRAHFRALRGYARASKAPGVVGAAPGCATLVPWPDRTKTRLPVVEVIVCGQISQWPAARSRAIDDGLWRFPSSMPFDGQHPQSSSSLSRF